MSNRPVAMKRDEIIAALESRRGEFEAIDKTAMAEHIEKEREFLVRFRAMLKHNLKRTYRDLADDYFALRDPITGERWNRNEAPECPLSLVAQLDNELAYLRITNQQNFTLEINGRWGGVLGLITYGRTTSTSLC